MTEILRRIKTALTGQADNSTNVAPQAEPKTIQIDEVDFSSLPPWAQSSIKGKYSTSSHDHHSFNVSNVEVDGDLVFTNQQSPDPSGLTWHLGRFTQSSKGGKSTYVGDLTITDKAITIDNSKLSIDPKNGEIFYSTRKKTNSPWETKKVVS